MVLGIPLDLVVLDDPKVNVKIKEKKWSMEPFERTKTSQLALTSLISSEELHIKQSSCFDFVPLYAEVK